MKLKKIKHTYDIICFYETEFQKIIIEYLVQTKYSESTVLIINAIGNHLEFNENKISIKLDTYFGIIQSIKNLNKIPKFKCKYLIGSHISSLKSRMFMAFIKYEKLILTDDGIGTPVIIQKNNFYWHTPYTFKFLTKVIALKLVFLLYGKWYFSLNYILKKIDFYYYTFYNPSNLSGKLITPLKKLKNPKYEKTTGFLGSPSVDFGFIKKNQYIDILSTIAKKENGLKYFPHPAENWYKNEDIKDIVIVDKNCCFEEYIKNYPIPKKIIAFKSTVLLNMKIMCPKMDIYYLKSLKEYKYSILYYEVLKKFNIKKYIIPITQP